MREDVDWGGASEEILKSLGLSLKWTIISALIDVIHTVLELQ